MKNDCLVLVKAIVYELSTRSYILCRRTILPLPVQIKIYRPFVRTSYVWRAINANTNKFNGGTVEKQQTK